MANMMDYLDWRGDLSLLLCPFNEVDNLILAQLAYVNFEDIVPPEGSSESVTIEDASRLYHTVYDEAVVSTLGYMVRVSAALLRKLAVSPRFAHARLSHYVNRIELLEPKQFSAVHILLEDGTRYVAFRGTDSTIAGWKENFHMSFTTPVPAQLEAVRYLKATAGCTQEPLRLGGHSKGGNLAVYAAVHCGEELQSKIMEIYNNDGPGFERTMTRSEAYQGMLGRIKMIVPQSSIVGMLLEHEEAYTVVKSSQKVFLQHDPMSWEVLGKQFVQVGSVARHSELLDLTLKSWLRNLDRDQREQFVEAMFYIFEASNVHSFSDLSINKWRKASEMITVLKNMPPENREAMGRAFKLLFQEGRRVFRENKRAQRGGGL